jgi:hypothetical protein
MIKIRRKKHSFKIGIIIFSIFISVFFIESEKLNAEQVNVRISDFQITKPLRLRTIPEDNMRNMLSQDKIVATPSPEDNNSIEGYFIISNEENFWDGNLNYEILILSDADNKENNNLLTYYRNEAPISLSGSKILQVDYKINLPFISQSGNYILKIVLYKADGELINEQKQNVYLIENNDFFPLEYEKAMVYDSNNEVSKSFVPDTKNKIHFTFKDNKEFSNIVPKIIIREKNRFGKKVFEKYLPSFNISSGNLNFDFDFLSPEKPAYYYLNLIFYDKNKDKIIAPIFETEFLNGKEFANLKDLFSSFPKNNFLQVDEENLRIGVSAYFLGDKSKKFDLMIQIFDNKDNLLESKKETFSLLSLPLSPPNYYFDFKFKKIPNSFLVKALLEDDGRQIDEINYYYNYIKEEEKIIKKEEGESINSLENNLGKDGVVKKDQKEKKINQNTILNIAILILTFLLFIMFFYYYKHFYKNE